jgi:hypothetical protein
MHTCYLDGLGRYNCPSLATRVYPGKIIWDPEETGFGRGMRFRGKALILQSFAVVVLQPNFVQRMRVFSNTDGILKASMTLTGANEFFNPFLNRLEPEPFSRRRVADFVHEMLEAPQICNFVRYLEVPCHVLDFFIPESE